MADLNLPGYPCPSNAQPKAQFYCSTLAFYCIHSHCSVLHCSVLFMIVINGRWSRTAAKGKRVHLKMNGGRGGTAYSPERCRNGRGGCVRRWYGRNGAVVFSSSALEHYRQELISLQLFCWRKFAPLCATPGRAVTRWCCTTAPDLGEGGGGGGRGGSLHTADSAAVETTRAYIAAARRFSGSVILGGGEGDVQIREWLTSLWRFGKEAIEGEPQMQSGECGRHSTDDNKRC